MAPRLDRPRHLEKHAPGVRRDPWRAFEVSLVDFPVHGHVVVMLKREESGQQEVEDEPARPEIGLGAVIAALRQHLRRDVRRHAASGVHCAVARRKGAEAKVRDLEVGRMVGATAMAEIDGGNELLEVGAGNVRRPLATLENSSPPLTYSMAK
ncbi:hypothetical protein EJ110_NYTH23934 [Nymphaea thermarum]|nr:hypothetical protein EJ110_NYTH23934 [Nymphaea thermarum]